MIDLMFLDYFHLMSFERPYLLLIALQPLLLSFFRQLKIHSLSKYSDKNLWPWAVNISMQYFKTRKTLRFIAWFLLAIAISGPRLPGLNSSISNHNKNIKNDISIMVVLDVNGINKSEFNTYLIQLSDFLDNLNGEKIGFIALSSYSTLISPLTNDYKISYFYLKQMFNIINLNPRLKTNNLFKSLNTSFNEIKSSQATTGVIIYWSDYLRKPIKNNKLIKAKILIEEIESEGIKIIPLWNTSTEFGMESSDIRTIFGNSSKQYSNLDFQNIYNHELTDIKSTVIFNTNKNHGFQELYSYPLILGLLLLLLSLVPSQGFNRVKHES